MKNGGDISAKLKIFYIISR